MGRGRKPAPTAVREAKRAGQLVDPSAAAEARKLWDDLTRRWDIASRKVREEGAVLIGFHGRPCRNPWCQELDAVQREKRALLKSGLLNEIAAPVGDPDDDDVADLLD